jgi:hypothetical protein
MKLNEFQRAVLQGLAWLVRDRLSGPTVAKYCYRLERAAKTGVIKRKR